MRLVFGFLAVLAFWSVMPAQAQEDYGPWRLSCSDDYCEIFQRLVISGGERTAATLAFRRYDADGATEVLMLLPLGIALQPGVRLVLDDEQFWQFDPRACFPDGCRVAESVPPGMLNNLFENDQVALRFFPATSQDLLNIAVSLEAFEAAHTALQNRVAQR